MQDPVEHQRPTSRRRLWGFLALVLMSFSIGYAWTRLRPHPRSWPGGQVASAATPHPGELEVYGTVPDFEFADRGGKSVRRSDLLGNVWIADFIFTNCSGTCPIMTMRMKGLLEALGDLEGVRLVSISVDPDRDTPEALNQYADRYQAYDRRWHFLTGEREAVYRLSREGFRLAVGEVPPEQLGPGDEAILHSDRFVLVDQRGRIRGLYRGAGPDSETEVQRLAEDVRRLIDDTPAP